MLLDGDEHEEDIPIIVNVGKSPFSGNITYVGHAMLAQCIKIWLKLLRKNKHSSANTGTLHFHRNCCIIFVTVGHALAQCLFFKILNKHCFTVVGPALALSYQLSTSKCWFHDVWAYYLLLGQRWPDVSNWLYLYKKKPVG